MYLMILVDKTQWNKMVDALNW